MLLTQEADCDHTAYNPDCTVCVEAGGRKRAHWRHKSTVSMELLADTVHVDLAEFTGTLNGKVQPHHRVLIAAHSSGVTMAIPIRNKSEVELMTAIREALLLSLIHI